MGLGDGVERRLIARGLTVDRVHGMADTSPDRAPRLALSPGASMRAGEWSPRASPIPLGPAGDSAMMWASSNTVAIRSP